MANRHFPVRPNIDQVRLQAKELLRGVRSGDPVATAEFNECLPSRVEPSEAKLADAQFALARSYGLASWPRLVVACKMTNAIWENDIETVRRLVKRDPKLITEDARGVEGNWGPPMSYAANLGKDEIIEMLHRLGAADVQRAFIRACLQGQLDTARILFQKGAWPEPGIVMGPCETLNRDGLGFLLELGAKLEDEHQDPLAPIALILQTYSRGPRGKHQCLELVAEYGVELPDTPPMAVHRGRIDLLETHLLRDPEMLSRTFSHEEIFPPELGCDADWSLALVGTPLDGGTLLHMCVDYDEFEIAKWLVAHGADVNAKADVDADGFGGHTALFGTVVSQTYAGNCRKDADFARFLLDHGADTSVLASLRKQLRFVPDETMHEFRDVTPLTWGERFHNKAWVNRSVMRLIQSKTSPQSSF